MMPNFSELSLEIRYGPDLPDVDLMQSAKIYSAISEDSDELDHKFIEEIPFAGRYVELAHYSSVKQVVLQNMGKNETDGLSFHADAVTGAVIPVNIRSGESVSFNALDPVAGIMVYAQNFGELTDFHLVIVGAR